MYKWKDYWPWGRPGGGAPCAGALRKKNVPLEPPAKLSARTPSRSSCFDVQLISQRETDWGTAPPIEQMSSLAVRDPRDTTIHSGREDKGGLVLVPSRHRPGQDPRKTCDERSRVYRVIEDVELLPPLRPSCRGVSRDFRDLSPKEQLRRTTSVRYAATDATRPGYIIDSLRSSKANCRNYAVQLLEQIRQKQAISEKEHRRDEAECRRHFDAWERLWGSRIDLQQLHRRNNLHQILYTTAGP